MSRLVMAPPERQPKDPRAEKQRDYRRQPHGRQQTKAERQIEADHIRARDKGCVLAELVPGHVCRDRWGVIIPSSAVLLMTFEHVKEGLGGRKPPLDRWHSVLACWHANVWTVETSKYRPEIRDYLARVEGTR
jgi:hypothetical protein